MIIALGFGFLTFLHLVLAHPSPRHSANNEQLLQDQLVWAPCHPKALAPHFSEWSTNLQCGNMTVPLDWNDPTGQKIQLGLVRQPCLKPSQRIGTAFWNPGGPGVSTIEAMEDAPLFSEYINDHFDIVGLDTRGVSHSTPLRCAPDLAEKLMSVPQSEREFEQRKADSVAWAESCTRLSGDLVKFMDTASVAKDFEAARRLVGDEKITYVGFSWGTAIGTTYAELFPDKIRALILDGVIDWWAMDPVTLNGIRQGAKNTEALTNNIIHWADNDDHSALKGMGTARVLQETFDSANEIIAHPRCEAESELDDGYTTLEDFTSDLFSGHTPGALPSKKALQDGVHGFKETWRSLQSRSFCNEPYTVEPSLNESIFRSLQNEDAANKAYFCNDWAFPPDQQPDYEQFKNRVQSLAESAPHTRAAGSIGWVSMCLGWPYRSANRPHRLHFANNPPPILMVNALWDPATGYEWAKSVHSQIAGSVLLTRNGTGHCSYESNATKPSKATQIMDDYLVHLKLPAAGLVVPN